eukprot:TRINITY_DN1762_c0_g2_i1.p1 TRINITY_DN1762_c0_g2~~TRINITY_DN1762_c0_g2_i1.p1  ORF type:complete len:203 (-),score=43.45 TRINITY_DN1762_c0_g2_i1:91-699(-)
MMKKFSLASALYHEMGTCLKYLRRYKEAAKEFRKAAELHQTESAISAINSLSEAFACSIECLEFSDAFKDLQWIIKLSTEEGYETNSQFFLDKKIEALVSLIFVLLLSGDFAQSKLVLQLVKREHSISPTQNSTQIYYTNEWFFLLLEEVISVFEEGEREELDRYHGELHTTLTPIQNRLYLLLMDGCQPDLCKRSISSYDS